ncbi:MAG: ribonuclease III [Minisyncoccia bacterium]
MQPDLIEFQKSIGITFNNKKLLEQAFIHRSYINENRQSGLEHNERLEFLGDAVLELAITNWLFQNYTDKPEGELTAYRSALVNADTCANIAKKIEMEGLMMLSKGESKDKGRARQYILANALEALIGAIYLDQGLESATKFINDHFMPLIDSIIKQKSFIDSKSLFQEKAQEFDGVTPSYKTIKETGPDHEKKFTVGVFVGKEQIALGEGISKQEAEQNAAKEALLKRGWN